MLHKCYQRVMICGHVIIYGEVKQRENVLLGPLWFVNRGADMRPVTQSFTLQDATCRFTLEFVIQSAPGAHRGLRAPAVPLAPTLPRTNRPQHRYQKGASRWKPCSVRPHTPTLSKVSH